MQLLGPPTSSRVQEATPFQPSASNPQPPTLLHASPSRSQACKQSPIVLNAIYMLTPPKFMPPGWISPQDSRLVHPPAYLAFLQGCLIAASDFNTAKTQLCPPPTKGIAVQFAILLFSSRKFLLSCSQAPNHEPSLTPVTPHRQSIRNPWPQRLKQIESSANILSTATPL